MAVLGGALNGADPWRPPSAGRRPPVGRHACCGCGPAAAAWTALHFSWLGSPGEGGRHLARPAGGRAPSAHLAEAGARAPAQASLCRPRTWTPARRPGARTGRAARSALTGRPCPAPPSGPQAPPGRPPIPRRVRGSPRPRAGRAPRRHAARSRGAPAPAGRGAGSAYSSPTGPRPKLLPGAPSGAGAAGARRQPRWFGPRRVLALFCYIMFLCYMDNGLLASNGVTGTKSTSGGTEGEGGLTARCPAAAAAAQPVPRGPPRAALPVPC
jgi:hypothetical protein